MTSFVTGSCSVQSTLNTVYETVHTERDMFVNYPSGKGLFILLDSPNCDTGDTVDDLYHMLLQRVKYQRKSFCCKSLI
jgi:hypothetical protein